jgi:hypothetical protein
MVSIKFSVKNAKRMTERNQREAMQEMKLAEQTWNVAFTWGRKHVVMRHVPRPCTDSELYESSDWEIAFFKRNPNILIIFGKKVSRHSCEGV